MIGVGIAAMLIAVFGMIVGWIFVGQLATASDDSLDVTLQSLDAIDDTIDLADDVLVSTADGITALAGTLTAVSGSFDAGTQAIDDIAGLATTIGPSLEDAGSTVRTLERIGDDIDSVLGALSNLPLAPDYDPSAGLGDTFGQLADTLEALPGQLESTAVSLTEFTGSADELQQQLIDTQRRLLDTEQKAATMRADLTRERAQIAAEREALARQGASGSAGEQQRHRSEFAQLRPFLRRNDRAGIDHDSLVPEAYGHRLGIDVGSGRHEAEMEAEAVEQAVERFGQDPTSGRIAVVRARRDVREAGDFERLGALGSRE